MSGLQMVSFTVPYSIAGIQLLRMAADHLAKSVATEAPSAATVSGDPVKLKIAPKNEAPAEAPKKRGRPPRAETLPPAVVAAEDEEIEEPEEEDFDDESEDGDESGDSDMDFSDEEEAPKKPAKKQAPTKAAATKLTLEGDVLPALQTFAKKYSKEKAHTILKKFGVKSPREIEAARYGEFLKALKA